MSKLCQTFQSPYSLHKPPQTILFHTYLPRVCGQISKNIFFFWMFLWRNSSLTKTTDSYSFILKKYLNFVNLCHITLSLNHSIMCAAVGAKKLANQKRKILLSMKTLLLLLTKSSKSPNTCFMSFFCFFFRFRFLAYCDHYRKFTEFDSLKPIKKY